MYCVRWTFFLYDDEEAVLHAKGTRGTVTRVALESDPQTIDS